MKRKYVNKDEAVSPVVGVMLMLVVTIIIAAVVSAFAGGLGSGTQKPPSVSAETSITNSGYYYGSQFSMVITGVSDPVPTKDVKIVTRWRARDGTNNGTTVYPNVQNFQYGNASSPNKGIAPWGAGPGTDGFGMFNTKKDTQWFGNYTLTAGMSMRAYPAGAWGPISVPATYGGYGPGPVATYVYTDATSPDGYHIATDVDGMQAVLGMDWNKLRPGDIVNVKLVHIPTGKMMYEQDVAVKGVI
jgi:FlaG/FlaF family flagellin (archaellin)